MAMRITRRRLLEAAGTAAVAGTLPGFSGTALAQDAESHGLSTFGELALPPDFPHFAYVNPKAPKGGMLTVQIKRGGGNQSFDTFNTLNTFVDKVDELLNETFGGTSSMSSRLTAEEAEEVAAGHRPAIFFDWD